MASGGGCRTLLGSAVATAASTAAVWREVRVVGMDGKKRDWLVCFMHLGSIACVTMGKLWCRGLRELARNWEKRRERLAGTGRISASL